MKIQIQKRDGRLVPFDHCKIIDAVLAAFKEVDGDITDYALAKAGNIADYIYEYAENQPVMTVEQVQDLVEKGLMSTRRKDVAKAYILYREERSKARGNLTDNTLLDFLSGKSEYWNTENSNKDSAVVTTQRDYIAGISSTDIARRFLLPKEVCEAHDEGIIHEHDMDYLAQRALTNCALLNMEDVLKNGTVVNNVRIDPQTRLLTAVTVTTQVITAAASSMYGGTTITLTHLAPYVRLSFANHYKAGLEYLEGIPEDQIDYEIEFMLQNAREYSIYDREYSIYSSAAYDYAMDMTKKEIRDAVQTFNYQINSMSTTNGQSPFLSVFMWTGEAPEYKKEIALLIEEFLNQRITGMKNEKGVYVTQAFPKLLYVLDEDNIKENTEFWYLTELSAKCTAKRMVPDYISAKKMREYKISPKTGESSVYGCMGKCKLQLM